MAKNKKEIKVKKNLFSFVLILLVIMLVIIFIVLRTVRNKTDLNTSNPDIETTNDPEETKISNDSIGKTEKTDNEKIQEETSKTESEPLPEPANETPTPEEPSILEDEGDIVIVIPDGMGSECL